MRGLATAAALVAVAVLVWRQRAELASGAAALGQGAVAPLVLAGCLVGGRVCLHSLGYARSFAVVGGKVPLRATVPAWFKAVFMNTVVPSGGTSGLAAVIDAARQRGVAVGSATTAALFTQCCYYTAMTLVIAAVFAVMARSGDLRPRDVLLGSVIGLAAAAFMGLLLLGHYAPALLQRAMRAVERLVWAACDRLRVKKRPEPWADSLVHSFSSAAAEFSRRPAQAASVLVSLLGATALDLAAFASCGLAFGIGMPQALLGGYVSALVFNSFSPTPGGVGVVEGLTAAVVAGYGVPLSLALSAVMSYRVLTYWAPFIVGAVMMRTTRAFGQAAPAQGEGAAPGRPRPAPAPAPSGAKARARARACALLAGAAAAAGLVASALPQDPALAEAVSNLAFGTGPAGTRGAVVLAYLLAVLVPGLAWRDRACWLASIAALACLGVAEALSARPAWALLLVVAALAALVARHGCFRKAAFLERPARAAWSVCHAAAADAACALACGLAARADVVPDPGLAGALELGLRAAALMGAPDGWQLGQRAAWLVSSAQAVTVCFLLAAAAMAAAAVLSRRARARGRRDGEPRA